MSKTIAELIHDAADDWWGIIADTPDAIERVSAKAQVAMWHTMIQACHPDGLVSDRDFLYGYYAAAVMVKTALHSLGLPHELRVSILYDVANAIGEASWQMEELGALQPMSKEDLESAALLIELERFRRAGQA